MSLNRKKDIKEIITGTSFVLPAIIFILLFTAYPVIQSLILSFFNWRGVGPKEFYGIKNFIYIFAKDRYFWKSVTNTFIFTFLMMSGEIILGFIYAVLIDLGIRFWKIYRFIFFLPVALSQVVVSLLWVKIFQDDGIINSILGIIHLEKYQQVWLGDARFAMWCLVFVTWWQWGGYNMIFFLAGMQNIDPSIYESAKIDGASTMRRIFTITIPLLKNVWFVLLTLSLISGFKMFDIVYIMTNGGPAGATEVMGTHLYNTAFVQLRYGRASVIAVVMVILSLIVSYYFVKISGYGKEISE